MVDDMPIGAFSRRTGCAIETIRFYEKIGVLPTPRRRGRYRHYTADDVTRLTFIRRARELGFTLDEVRTLLRLATSGDACGDARSLAAKHLKGVRARLADLRSMERILAQTVRECDAGKHTICPLIDALSVPVTT